MAETSGRGAFAFKEHDHSITMIDHPMLLQSRSLLQRAEQAAMTIPWTKGQVSLAA
jgi:hypothetical protein